MAEPTDSSLAFFTKGTAKQWAFIYELRSQAIRAKADQRSSKKGGPEEFIKLDNWYREKLPALIKSRKEAHVLYDELVQIAKWRLMMGKYRPKMLDLIRCNTESACTGVTRKAYKKITHGKNLQQAITMLVNLKGIGPSTGSAILSAAFPEEAPFMSDEGMQSTPGVEANDSTIAEYMNYSDQLRNKCEWLKKLDPEFKWTIHKVDQALWIYFVARDLKPSLLDAMPRGDDCTTPTSTSSSAAPELADDNANDCTSSNEASAVVTTAAATTNGIHHHHEDSNSESASVPYSEEEFSQGGEASCSSSVAAADSNLSNGHCADNNNHHSAASATNNNHNNHHLSPVTTTSSTTSSISPDNGHAEVTPAAAGEVTTNGTKRPANCMLNSSTNSSGVGEGEDSSSQNGLGGLDSEDSRGDGGLMMMMTPSEENSIDGPLSAGDEDLSQDQPPMKKQKTLELSTALAAATATAEE